MSLVNNENLKNKLILFRKERASENNIPAYYLFSNAELAKLVEVKPKELGELKNILPDIKIRNHGEQIIAIINNRK